MKEAAVEAVGFSAPGFRAAERKRVPPSAAEQGPEGKGGRPVDLDSLVSIVSSDPSLPSFSYRC